MNRLLVSALALAFGAVSASAQSLDDLNIQIHGYATQGFLYTTQNNILTTSSSSGSPAWTEAVLNVGAEPIPKLRVGVQGRYFLLGNYGNTITLDWAAGDYKVNDKFGVRFGKVKTPSGLFNDIQDIDPSYIWSLLPQSIYPISSRNSILAHYGGVVYGTLKLGQTMGKLEYRGFGGERSIGTDDGYFLAQREAGIVLPNGLNRAIYGAALHWKTPLRGLMVGASTIQNNATAPEATKGTLVGVYSVHSFNQPNYFVQYERGKFMVAGEYGKTAPMVFTIFPGIPPIWRPLDNREWYGMATYKLTGKLTAGLYDSQYFSKAVKLGPARYQKDWALAGRYDFNQYLYAKAEQHWVDGTSIGYDVDLNPNGLKPTTKLTILKIGVSF
jgi:hypothetical protein